MYTSVRQPLLVLSLCALGASPSFGLEPQRRLTQFAHDQWGPRDGAPAGTILAISQTPDGYLWLAAQAEGLVRFDGVRFDRVRELDALFPLETTEVRSLHTARDGTLWVGTSDGLARRHADRWDLVEEGRGREVAAIGELDDGTIVLARDRLGLGVVRPDGVEVHRLGARTNRHLAALADGSVALGNGEGLHMVGLDGSVASSPVAGRVTALHRGAAGRLWVATRDAGLHRLEGDLVVENANALGVRDATIATLLEDSSGSLWIGSATRGLARLGSGGLEWLTARGGLSSDGVSALFEDREGSLWVATTAGLDRLRAGALVPFGMPEGLAADTVASVLETRDGTLWAFSDGAGLNRVATDGRARTLTRADGMASDFGGPLFESRDGRLWVGHDRGLTSVRGDRCRAFVDGPLGEGYVAAIGEDEQSLIVYVLGVGLLRFRPETGATEPYRVGDGQPLDVRMPFAIHHARDGSLWLATVGGLVVVRDGTARWLWNAPRSAVAVSIHEDDRGVHYVGTWHGLLRVEGDQVVSLGVGHGLPRGKVFAVLEDGRGSLWLSGPHGLARVPKADVDAVADGAMERLQPALFGVWDGMRTPEATAPAPPMGWRGSDGRMWFTSRAGLVAVDPGKLHRNPLPPPVVVEGLVLDGVREMRGPVVELPPGARQIEIRYNALSLLVPERVRFRYRLEGYDEDWIDAGRRRSAFYANLPPGRRTFRVSACNNDGVWNEAGATLTLSVSPRWYQTGWFVAFGVVGLIATVGLADRVRLRRIASRERMLERRVRERTEALRLEMAERERAQTALLESEERYELAIRGANEGIWDWDLESDAVFLSPLWKAMLGYEEREIEDRVDEWFSRIHPEDGERVRAKLVGYRGSAASLYTDEFRIRHKDGAYRWMLARGFAVRDAEGGCHRIVGAMMDVTDRRSYDPLTGLPNRARFAERLDELFAAALGGQSQRFAVLLLGLDRFKLINDSLGHVAGDRLLVDVARRIEGCLRPDDFVARFPGDEFAVLVSDVARPVEAEAVTQRIQSQMAKPFTVEGAEAYATVTIGIAVFHPGYTRVDEILRDADTAMHAAKQHGRSAHELFHPGMRAEVLSALELEAGLHHGIDRNEFVLHYQPIVCLRTGRIEGFEALVRWNHPTRGQLLPCEFIPLAEEARIIGVLGHWVRREACRQLRSWRGRGVTTNGLWLSVNVSPREFAEPEFVRRLRGTLRKARIPVSKLRIEITETTLMAGDHRVAEAVKRLQELRVPLDVDDFGTGFSSLSYLQQLPVSALKIDRSFIEKLGPNDENLAFIQTMVELARSLGIPVVAEGVETEAQLAQVQRAGCDHAQGFFFSRPVSARRAEELLARAYPLPSPGEC